MTIKKEKILIIIIKVVLVDYDLFLFKCNFIKY